MGETRVDLTHLLEDLRDAYPGSTEETILTEIVANALDSGATHIALATDAAAPALTIVDDGRGMKRRELARYHDIAASTKTRGAGIGFAGVGIKIALLVCNEVVTETRRGTTHVASSWHLASRQKAPWHWTPPPGLVAARGTAVRLVPETALSPLLDPGFVEVVLRRHFAPFFDLSLAEILAQSYPKGVRFSLNGQALDPSPRAGDGAPIAIRLGRRRKPAGVGYMVRDPLALPDEDRGLAISTFGKVIKRGWDWLGLAPSAAEHVRGIIEIPALAECLTLNKADFIRSGSRGATYLAYRKAVQEAVAHQLAAWGDAPAADERARRRAARPVERDLESVLADLAPTRPHHPRRRATSRRTPPMSPPARARGGRCGTASASSSRRGPTIRSSVASWNRPCGSTRRIRHTAARSPLAPRAITWRWPSRSRWRRSPWSRRRSTASSPRSLPGGAKPSIVARSAGGAEPVAQLSSSSASPMRIPSGPRI
jgi:hypothetical protein